MKVVSFLHQKGGTGKSTLAIAAACVLAAEGRYVRLVDADPQGTAAEWGLQHGAALGVEVLHHIQPDLEEVLAEYPKEVEWVLVDAPPGLHEVTEAILRASKRVVLPLRPALPDLWALRWPAAIITKLGRAGRAPEALVVVNLHRGEPLEAITGDIAALGLTLHPDPIPADPAFADLFRGKPLPPPLARRVRALLE